MRAHTKIETLLFHHSFHPWPLFLSSSCTDHGFFPPIKDHAVITNSVHRCILSYCFNQMLGCIVPRRPIFSAWLIQFHTCYQLHEASHNLVLLAAIAVVAHITCIVLSTVLQRGKCKLNWSKLNPPPVFKSWQGGVCNIAWRLLQFYASNHCLSGTSAVSSLNIAKLQHYRNLHGSTVLAIIFFAMLL